MKPKKLIMNARNPEGFWGRMMIRSMNFGHTRLTGWGLRKIPFRSTDIVLDVGCGGGKTVARIAKKVPYGKVCGVDYSELSVSESEKYNRKQIRRQRVRIDCAGVSALPYIEGYFDVVTAVETFYFWPNPTEDLKEVRRVMKTGGRLYLIFETQYEESNPGRWKEYEQMIGMKVPSRSGLARQLREAGFRKIRMYTSAEGWLCAEAQNV